MGQSLPITLSEIKGLLNLLWNYDTQHPAPDLLSSLLQQIHPLAIANLQQADTLARNVSRRALQMHMHPEDTSRVESLVNLFNGGFHSPLYTAGRNELKEVGLPVTDADDELWSSIWGLVQLYQATIYNDRPDPTAPGAFFRYVCLIESEGRTTGLRQSFTQVEGQERVLQVRWETAVKGPGPGPSFGPGGVSNN
jgi:hypothetical protein